MVAGAPPETPLQEPTVFLHNVGEKGRDESDLNVLATPLWQI